MPFPKPNTGESKSAFLSRCLSDETIIAEFEDMEQRVSVCNSLWPVKQLEHEEQKLNKSLLDIKPKQYEGTIFNLQSIKQLFQSNLIDTGLPTLFITQDELIKEGSSDRLDLTLKGLEGELAGIYKAKILSLFPENLRSRINIDTWSDLGSTPWGSHVAVAQTGLIPYNGDTVIENYDEDNMTVFSEYRHLEIGSKYHAPVAKIKEGFTTKRIIPNTYKVQMLQSGLNVAYFSGIAMTPGIFNGDTFDADVLSASIDYWKGIPLTLNHEDETDPYTTILGRVLKAWWDKVYQELWVQAIVETPITVEMLNKGIYPDMSPKLDLYIDINTNKIVEIIPVHLSLLIEHAPANPQAGVKVTN